MIHSLTVPDAPASALSQLADLLDAILALPVHWLGVYLHGSLAMGSFQPHRSDLDVLAVSDQPLVEESLRKLAADCLRISSGPHPIEISCLACADLHPWRYPTPYQFHFSEAHRGRLAEGLSSGVALGGRELLDPDLAAHITVTLARGICLWGRPAAEIIRPVPRQDLLDSLFQDFDWAEDRGDELASYQVLNLCRTLAWCRDGQVRSKLEGGEWGIINLPPRFKAGVTAALLIYKGKPARLPVGFFEKFCLEMRALIRADALPLGKTPREIG
jgi:hypothetical protein